MRSGNKNKGANHNRYKHGMSGTIEYKTWASMKGRCYRKSSPDYKNYGGRGIKVCDEWQDFDGFFKDMGLKPSKEFTIERKDPNKDYTKENCIWADRTTQSRNRSYVKLSIEKAVEIKKMWESGETVTSIAKTMCISRSQAWRVAAGKSWKAL